MSSSSRLMLVGGADVHHRIPFVREMTKAGFKVAVAGSGGGPMFRDAGISFFPYRLERGIAPWADLQTRTELIRLMDSWRPSIVHGFDTKPSYLVPLAARRTKVPLALRTITGMGFVFSSHGLQARGLRPIYRALHRRAARAAAWTVFQNQDDQDEFLAHGMADPSRCSLIPGSGVDFAKLEAEAEAGPEPEQMRRELKIGPGPVILMVARLVRHKGVIQYLQAAKLVRRRRQDAVFLLVGPLSSEGRQAVSKRTLLAYRDHVRWLGPRSDVPSLIKLARLVVLPSFYREGVPRVLLEAAALGKALVATDMPGCRDVVQEGVTGRLVPPRTVAPLAAALAELLDQPQVVDRMGEAARKHVRGSFSLRAVAAGYADLYQRLLAGGGLRPNCGGAGVRNSFAATGAAP
ncbi:MAG: glycosyltransferase family 1 protein [Planctomycetota bacterium]|nr:MAG: glycosyltransferase family 1 protein [Planctomycetota bacterium]